MCGIIGILGASASEHKLDKMLFAQRHRGPDYTGKYIDKEVALGHNRLAIIDLTPSANQPFYSEDKRYSIIFNGEIYNYIELRETLISQYNFKTNSDTEVLLAAYIHWGEQCLKELNGMFSFAIYDTHTQSLFAARDRFGVKPFYYHKTDDNFYFASEIKSLFASGIEQAPNEKVWANYFVYGSYGMPEETFWQGIVQLPGGHFLTYTKGELEISKWYVFEEEVKKYEQRLSFDEVQEKYEQLLKDSINLRFRSDVTVGFNISGGLDSSTLLAYVNQNDTHENINAYTFYTNDERYDELPWVEEMIKLTNNPLQKVLLTSEEASALSLMMAQLQDEPYGGIPTIAYGKIFESARKDGVLVLLDGQGMDEQWAGYDYYVKKSGSVIQGVNKSPFRKEVLSEKMKALAEKPNYPKPFNDEVLNLQYRDLFYTKIPRALRFNDRVSMGVGTELREPFLDYRLVEFAFAQPLEYKIKDGQQKYLLRTLVSKHLSDTISYAPKRPLQTPQREWLGNEMKSFVASQIELIESTPYGGWFDIERVKQEWELYLSGDNDSSFHIWQWLSCVMLNYTNNKTEVQ